MIRLVQISKQFGKTPAVADFTLTIPAGKTTVLIGPSGCGKTTTLEMINGLTRPDSGKVYVGGLDISQVDLTALRRKIGYVIQDVGLFPHYTVRENIAVVPRLLKRPEAQIHSRVEEMASLVNLNPDILDRYPAQLSGGQQQRVGVARALAADPEYLLMDEPFSALDPVNRERLQAEFLAVQARLGKTVVFVTHDMNEALRIGDQIAVMQKGRLVQSASPLELLLAPRDRFVRDFLGGQRIPRLLQLTRIKDLATLPEGPDSSSPNPELPSISKEASLQDALDLLLRTGAKALRIESARNSVSQRITWPDIQAFIAGL